MTSMIDKLRHTLADFDLEIREIDDEIITLRERRAHLETQRAHAQTALLQQIMRA
jgi:chorismate mutase